MNSGKTIVEDNKRHCLFIHGWGMNHRVWQGVIDQLPGDIETDALDLPGHGGNTASTFASLDELVKVVDAHVDRPQTLVAWSLGGLAALAFAARYPQRVEALVLVACTPCFVARSDWPHAMQAEVFEQFAREFDHDHETTLRRFLNLQVFQSESGRKVLKALRGHIFSLPSPQSGAMAAGLEILKQCDLRNELQALAMPVHFILGNKDSLVHRNQFADIEKLSPAIHMHIYEGAAHAPFMSHQDRFCEELLTITKCVNATS